jgi:16S rRNA (adenine1518-N6/adenine1519-N6)-dimethyltransferase
MSDAERDGGMRAVLSRHGLTPKKSFGQNFLLDRNLSARLAELAAPEGAFVVEIGAGLGAFTAPLLERARRVIAIERDRDLVPVLSAELALAIDAGKLDVVEADAKTFDYRAAFDAEMPPRALVGNLPYQLTGPLLELAVALSPLVERAAFLVQLEVADRLAAAPGSDAYGALSVFAQAAYQVERALVVRRGAFLPQPNVDSAFVVLTPKRPPVARETDGFRRVVKAAFGQRRKKLRNAWAELAPRAALEAAAAKAGIDLEHRGEVLSVLDFARMTEALFEA